MPKPPKLQNSGSESMCESQIITQAQAYPTHSLIGCHKVGQKWGKKRKEKVSQSHAS